MQTFTNFLRANIYARTAAVVAVGVVLGAILLIGVRVIMYNPKATHYHANFALYIDGVREEFKSYTNYEEVAQCSLDSALTPAQRVHMHQPDNDVVHVHAEAVTWGNFFENLGFAVGKDFVATHEGIFANNTEKKVTYSINDKEVSSITNRVIGNEDRLLVSYGIPDQTELLKESASIRDTAHHHNETPDPASCSGTTKPSWRQRFEHAL